MGFLDSLFGSEEERRKKSAAVPMGPGLRVSPEAPPAPVATAPTAPPAKVVAPNFGDSRRGIKLELPTAPPVSSVSKPSAAGSVLKTNVPAPRTGPMKTVTGNFPELQGFVDEKILATGSVAMISEAIINAQQNEAKQNYKPLTEKSSWLDRVLEPAKQAGRTIGDSLISQAQNIANYGLKPLGLVSAPITPYGRFEAGDRFLEEYAPERLMEARARRALEGELAGPQAAAKFATSIGETAVGSIAAINAFRSLPFAARLKASGESGRFATHIIENTIAGVVGSVPTSLGEGKAKEFPKMLATNIGFMFPAVTYKGLALATGASYLGNIAMGQTAWEAAANSLVGLTGGAAQRKDILDDLYRYRRGAFTDAVKTLIHGQMDEGIPDAIRNAAIDEAASLRAFYEQKPDDLPELYKMTLAAEKRMIKLYKEYKKASPTGERRLIGLGGPLDTAPSAEGGFPDKPPEPDVAVTKPLQLSIDGAAKAPEAIMATERLGQAIDASKGAIQGGDESKLFATPESAGQTSILDVAKPAKPLQLQEARRLAKDLFTEIEAEYNPEFRSRADDGPEYAAAEQNAGIAQEIVANRSTRTVLEAVTGKQGYAALELIETNNMGPLLKKLRARTEAGSPADQALAGMQARIRDDSDGEYGRMVLNELIAKSRGEVTGPRKRPNEDEILAVLDKAIQDGRLQMQDEIAPGRTVEKVYEALYNEKARLADALSVPARTPAKGALDGYINSKMAKKAAKKELLGDVLQKDQSRQIAKGKLTPQQIADERGYANLTGREIDAMNRADEQFAVELDENRKMTQIEFNRTVEEAKQLPPELAKKIIADLQKLKESGKIATPLEARLQRNKFLTRLLTQQKGMTRAAQRDAVRAKKDATNERMKSLHKTIPRMPIKIQKGMKFLHENYRKSMPLNDQLEMLQQMQTLNEIGGQQNRLLKEQREAADAKMAREIIKTAVKKLRPKDNRVRDRLGIFLRNETAPNLVISEMGEGAFKAFKDSMDVGMNEAWELQKKWDRQVLAKALEMKIEYPDMQKIVIYSLWNRGGKAGELAQKRLANMGLVDPRDPPTLDAKQKSFYDWQQQFIAAELAPNTKAVYERQNPQSELDTTDPAYFPMKVVANDMTVSKGAMGMTIDQVPAGFTKAIKGNESKDIYVEPDALFKHINDVAHYVALTDRMQQMRRVLERPDVINALGNENVEYLQNRWLDLVARHGNYAEQTNQLMAIVNSMGQRSYGGVLAGKLLVGLRQFGSVIDAMGPLFKEFGPGPTGTYIAKVIKNVPALADEHLTVLGKYIETNPDLQASVGLTDLVMEQVKGGEFSTRHTFLERHPKLNKFLFAVIRQPDLLGRATLAMHAEGLYKAQGVEPAEAQRKAMVIVNNVFGSMRVHNRPVASGHANTRPLYLFGQTMRARQGVFRKAGKELLQGKDPLGNAAILGSYTLSSMVLAFLGTLAIADDSKREDAQEKAAWWGILLSGMENTVPVIGPMLSRTVQTGEAGNAIPWLGMLMNAVGGAQQAVTGKTPETRMKGGFKAMEQGAGAIGLPVPAVRSNYNVIRNIFKDILGGKPTDESVSEILTDEQADRIDAAVKKAEGYKMPEGTQRSIDKALEKVKAAGY